MDERIATVEEHALEIARARTETVRAHEEYKRAVAEYDSLEAMWQKKYGVRLRDPVSKQPTVAPVYQNTREKHLPGMADRVRTVLAARPDVDFDSSEIAKVTGDDSHSIRCLLGRLVAEKATWVVRTSKGRYRHQTPAASSSPAVVADPVPPMSTDDRVAMPRIIDRVRSVFAKYPEREFTAAQIGAIVCCKPQEMANYLSTMALAGTIHRVSKGVYRAAQVAS